MPTCKECENEAKKNPTHGNIPLKMNVQKLIQKIQKPAIERALIKFLPACKPWNLYK